MRRNIKKLDHAILYVISTVIIERGSSFWYVLVCQKADGKNDIVAIKYMDIFLTSSELTSKK